MKRFLALLVVLILIAGVVFFFGWIQLQIPAGSDAVIFTKTHGWEESPIEPGEFAWRWQRLIPTNLSLFAFENNVQSLTVDVEGSLPGADTVEVFVNEPAAFDYEVSVALSVRVDPEALPTLAKENDLRPEGLDAYFASIQTTVADITQRVVTQSLNDGEVRRPDSMIDSLSRTVRSSLEEAVPELEVRALTVVRFAQPDYALYQRARELALDVMQARADALAEAAQQLAQQQTEEQNELDRLERYGQILDRYPVLLDYFRVGREMGGDPFDLESLIDDSPQ